MTPSDLKASPILGIYVDEDGYSTILRTIITKEVSITRDGKAYDVDGTLRFPLGNVSGAVKSYAIGTEACTEYTVRVPSELNYEASCHSSVKTPFVAVNYSLMGDPESAKDLVFPGEEHVDEGGGNTILYIAIAVVAVLAIGAVIYYVRFMKP